MDCRGEVRYFACTLDTASRVQMNSETTEFDVTNYNTNNHLTACLPLLTYSLLRIKAYSDVMACAHETDKIKQVRDYIANKPQNMRLQCTNVSFYNDCKTFNSFESDCKSITMLTKQVFMVLF